MSNFNLSLRLSTDDMKILEELSSRQGLRKAEYIRMLLQTIYIAETTKEDSKGTYKFKIGEYGFMLDKEFIEQYAKELEGFFLDIEKRMQKVILSLPKRDKEIRIRKVVKPKKVA